MAPENPLLLRYSDSHIAWDYRASGELTTLRKALFRALPHNGTLLAIGDEVFNFGGLQSGNYGGITYVPSTAGQHTGARPPARQMEMYAADIRRINAVASEPTN